MRVLVFGHHLELGGSQVNSIELADSLARDHGHEMVMFAAPGPALELIREKGLNFVAAPHALEHPSPTVMHALRRVVHGERIELVHAWEWGQCLDAFYALQIAGQVPLLGTNMSMSVTRFLPRCLPITYGTPALVEMARRWHTGPVELLEPPVDVERNHPAACDPADFKARWGLGPDSLNVVIVSRLVRWLKLEGLLRSLDAVASLASQQPLRLVVVGGGSAFADLTARAEAINSRLGRQVIVMTGPLADPRPAYAAADLVLGMGSSILRAMAFAKPCIVLGEEGFSAPFTPDTSQGFLSSGFYGRGDGERSPEQLRLQILALLREPDRGAQLGAYGRNLVERRFSLQVGAAALDRLYRTVAMHPVSRPRAAAEGVRSGLHRAAAWMLNGTIRGRLRRSA
jgi:glycosyltransferase involved in cell wall biosynthesis